MLDLLLRNIVEKEVEGEENKCRTIKQENKKLNENVTKHKQGQILMELVGFKKEKLADPVWMNKGSISYVKGVRLDL